MLFFKKHTINHLESLLEESQPLKETFLKSSEPVREKYFNLIIEKRDAFLDAIWLEREEYDSEQTLNKVLFNEVKAYATRCNWNYIDPIFLMSCFKNLDERVIDKFAGLSLIYQSFRMIDDLLDNHSHYKGDTPTLYGNLQKNPITAGHVLSGSILPALLMICEGLRNSPDKYIDLAEKTLFGALYELENIKPLTIEHYNKMVEGKMVCYGLLLYGPMLDAMDIDSRTVMEAFLRRTFSLSQIANDLIDRKDDLERGQPNFWHIFGNSEEASDNFLNQLFELYNARRQFPPDFRPYVVTRLFDITNYIVQIIKEDDRQSKDR